jgi:hypothetical protein
MRIVELIIDGFKSYAVRTVISGWDDSFNSITGLNGSGKSNILDAICFCLGITTMHVVRAQNLQVCTYYSMSCAYTDGTTIGSDLQAWTSWSHQSQRHYRVRQSRQEQVSHWIRRICSDQCYSSDCAGRHKQILDQWSPSATTNSPESLPISRPEYQQPELSDYARSNYESSKHEGGGDSSHD